MSVPAVTKPLRSSPRPLGVREACRRTCRSPVQRHSQGEQSPRVGGRGILHCARSDRHRPAATRSRPRPVASRLTELGHDELNLAQLVDERLQCARAARVGSSLRPSQARLGAGTRRGSGVAIDVAVVAGDLLDIASSVPLDTQITVVLSYLERLAARVPTVVCSGNHDLDSRTDSGEKTTRWLTEARAHGVVVDGDSLDLGGWRLTACAWWEGPETLAALEERLDEAAADRPAHWSWAFHGPPRVRCRGPARATTATRSSPACSTPTARCRAVRPHPPGAVHERGRLGRAARATRGCSTPDTSSDRSRRPSRSISMNAPPRGTHSPGEERSTFSSRASGPSLARCRSAAGRRCGSAAPPNMPRWSSRSPNCCCTSAT